MPFNRPDMIGSMSPSTRRQLLQVAGYGTAGLSATRVLAGDALAAAGSAKRCIVLFLFGGPPQQSTWDPKPDAPVEVRGEFAPIATSVPGITIGEGLPLTAQHMQHIALLRAVATDDNAHSSSGYYMLTGTPHIPMNQENANPGFPNDHPTVGAVVQHLRQGEALLPPSVRLPHRIFNTDGSVWPGQDSGFLGHAANPWLFRCDPASPDYEVPDFQLAGDITLERLIERRRLLDQIEPLSPGERRDAEGAGFSRQQVQAFDLLSSPQARGACRLDEESDAVRDRYGRHQFGQSVLLARRLVEAGVSFVHVNWYRDESEPSDAPVWDSHVNEAQRLREVLLPPFDQAFSALLTDLVDRNMLDDTLVMVLSEFGRTPRINGRGGRDHWGHVFSVALAGGGIRGGQAYGSSDAQGGYPQSGVVRPPDLAATMFHCLGIDPHGEIHDPLGRPLPITRGEVISALV
jgi:uncharacterized protein (DUF1501 family)